jgi:Tfp pilus assembly protein PilF
VLNNLGDILRKTGKYAESITQSRRAMELARQTGNGFTNWQLAVRTWVKLTN